MPPHWLCVNQRKYSWTSSRKRERKVFFFTSVSKTYPTFFWLKFVGVAKFNTFFWVADVWQKRNGNAKTFRRRREHFLLKTSLYFKNYPHLYSEENICFLQNCRKNIPGLTSEHTETWQKRNWKGTVIWLEFRLLFKLTMESKTVCNLRLSWRWFFVLHFLIAAVTLVTRFSFSSSP